MDESVNEVYDFGNSMINSINMAQQISDVFEQDSRRYVTVLSEEEQVKYI